MICTRPLCSRCEQCKGPLSYRQTSAVLWEVQCLGCGSTMKPERQQQTPNPPQPKPPPQCWLCGSLKSRIRSNKRLKPERRCRSCGAFWRIEAGESQQLELALGLGGDS